MALVFPLSLAAFADKLRIASNPFALDEQMQMSGVGTGDVLAAKLAPSRWTTTVTLAPEGHLRARELQALIEALDGPINSFYLYPVVNCYPARDPGGVILGGNVVTIHTRGANNKSVRLTGLPPGYVITTGDMWAADYATNPVRRALHRASETVVADGAGITPLFDVTPHLPTGLLAGAAVTLKKPAAKMFRMPGPLQVQHTAAHSTISFQAVQRP